MGGELVACVKMMTSQLVVKQRQLSNDLEDEADDDLWVTSTIPGVTWNLNHRNNQMCQRLATNYY
jgi:hypothetical protein